MIESEKMELNGNKPHKLYKSRQNRIIDGVCGGIAEYFDVDPTIVRLLWVLITLMGGSGFLLYIIAMIIMPVNPEHIVSNQQTVVTYPPDKRRFFGVMLILIGAFFLLMNVGWFWGFSWWSFSKTILLPTLLIGIGAFLIYIHTTKKKEADLQVDQTSQSVNANEPPLYKKKKELKRSRTNRKLFGVCGGLADYFDVDPTLVRFVFVALILISFGWGLLIYIILGIIMPEEKFISQ